MSENARSSMEQRRAAAREWRYRHRFELEAALRFQRLSDALTVHGGHDAVVALARRAATDEQRHAKQCAELVSYLGGEMNDAPPVSDQALSPSGLSAQEQLTYEIVAMSCVTETLSCALLGALVERADDRHIQREMRSILQDEVRHSRMGWAYLAGEAPRGPQHFLADYLPAMLAGTVQPELFRPTEERPPEDALSGLGALTRRERLDTFVEAMRDVVFPGFEHFGIDATSGRRWLDQRVRG